MDKISIIVPVYNVEKYLKECLESIISQEYNNLEIILVNDGSTDQSLEICESYCNCDSRFCLINKENGGLSSARNRGLEIASGEYISFVDSDDIISKNYISNLYKTIKKYNSDIALSGYKRFSKELPIVKFSESDEELTSIEVLKRVLYQNNQEFFSVSACCKLYKREIFSNIKYPEGKINEDMAVIVPILEKCEKVACNYNQDYFYRVNYNSITNQSFNVRRMDAIEFSENMVDHFKDNECLKKASISMLFRRSVEMLSEMKAVNYGSNEIENHLLSNIKNYRKIIIFDKYARKSTRLAALLSYVSVGFILKIRMKQKYKKTRNI